MPDDDITVREDRLSAWIDGALDPAQADAFDRDLAADPEFARIAAQWRANDARIAVALTGAAQRPFPAATLALLAAPAANNLPANDNSRKRLWSVAGLGAIAATLVLAFASRTPMPLAAPDALSQALDRTPSLADAALPDGRHIVPALTTRAQDGRWCREYRDGGTVALACRGAGGQWRDEARGPGTTPEAATAPEAGAEIVVASGANDAVLDPAFHRLGAGDAVDAATEKRLIAGHWGD